MEEPERPLVGQIMEEVLAAKSYGWSPGTVARQRGIARNHLRRWNDADIAQITRKEVLAWLAEMTEAGVATTTQTKALALFRAVWAEARMQGLTSQQDPSSAISMRKPPVALGRTLNREELAALVGACAAEPALKVQILLAGVLGLRWGEVAGLDVGDVDVAENLIHIRASLARGEGAYVRKAPKTAAGARAVPVPPDLMRLLESHLVAMPSSGPLFLAAQGGRLNYHSARRDLARVAKRAGLRDMPGGWHALRRTAATLALQAGMTLKDVSVMLGHSTPSVTLTRYVASRDAHGLRVPLDAVTRHALGRSA